MHVNPVVILILIAFFVVPPILRAMRSGAASAVAVPSRGAYGASASDDDDDESDDGAELARLERDERLIARVRARAGSEAAPATPTLSDLASIIAKVAASGDLTAANVTTSFAELGIRVDARDGTLPAPARGRQGSTPRPSPTRSAAGTTFGGRPPLDARAPLGVLAVRGALAPRKPLAPYPPSATLG